MEPRAANLEENRRFTLIELLVVVAIMGILASILLPSLQQARQKGFQAVCTSNQKQIGVLLNLYSDDNNGNYPIYGTTYEDTVSWNDLLADYDGRDLTFAEKKQGHFNTDDYDGIDAYSCPASIQHRPGQVLSSYTLNSSFANNDASHPNATRGVAGWKTSNSAPETNYGWSIKNTEMANPSNFVVLTEAHLFNNLLGFTGAGGESDARAFIESYSPSQLPVHNSDVGGVAGFYVHGATKYKLNFLFGDTHVANIPVNSTLGDIGGTNFLTGAYTNWGFLTDTPWNALSE